jgi:hypothetical protein
MHRAMLIPDRVGKSVSHQVSVPDAWLKVTFYDDEAR